MKSLVVTGPGLPESCKRGKWLEDTCKWIGMKQVIFTLLGEGQ